jgi:hypothetical protein
LKGAQNDAVSRDDRSPGANTDGSGKVVLPWEAADPTDSDETVPGIALAGVCAALTAGHVRHAVTHHTAGRKCMGTPKTRWRGRNITEDGRTIAGYMPGRERLKRRPLEPLPHT